MNKTILNTFVITVMLAGIAACASKPYYPNAHASIATPPKAMKSHSAGDQIQYTNEQVSAQVLKKNSEQSNRRFQVYNDTASPYGNPRKAISNTSFSAQGQHFSSFGEWKQNFINRADAQGYDVRRLVSQAQLNQGVINSDKKQAEFMKMPWSYVDSAVSSSRVNGGRTKYSANRTTFNRIRSQYGVDPEIVAAIWGMESSYGGFTGNADLASSLASLAYEGRRRDFAEKELIALSNLLRRGDVRWSAMKGSWAGGMGHTQFIPGTWITQGVDADGDGRKNPWSKADALSSTANYLSNSGWKAGVAPVYEVRLPGRMNYSLIGQSLSSEQWRSQGLTFLNASAPRNTPLKLWLPAGIKGPALLTSRNFDVIKVYNNSSSYALGVSLLGQRIARKGSLLTAWPRHEKPLATYQVERLQQLLTSKGYDTKGADGIIGTNTRKAFARWQADNGQVPDGFICKRTAAALL